MVSDGSRENLRGCVDAVLKALRGTKRLNLFDPARREANYEIEHYAEVLNEMVKEGKFDYIGLYEVNADTVHHAYKVSYGTFLCWRTSALCHELGCARRGGRIRSEPSSLRPYEQQTKDGRHWHSFFRVSPGPKS